MKKNLFSKVLSANCRKEGMSPITEKLIEEAVAVLWCQKQVLSIMDDLLLEVIFETDTSDNAI